MTEQHSTSDRYITPAEGDAWATEAATHGKTGTQQLLAVERIPAEPRIREALRLADNSDVVVRRRLILADDQPVELADSYYPARLADGTPLAENKKIKGGAVRVLVDLGHPLVDVTETITARLPEGKEASLLNVDPGHPLVVLERISADQDGVPVEFADNRQVAGRAEPIIYRKRNTA